MEKKRNGLLEIYRFILCFWPLYFHNFFFWKRNTDFFSGEVLAVDFFFILSGFFLMKVIRRERETPILKGMARIMFSRVKPMAFTMCFILAFDLIYVLLFVSENHLEALRWLVRYWWFVLFLTVAAGLIYLLYRLVKSEKIFAAILGLVIVAMAVLQYAIAEKGMFFNGLSFATRTLGCLPLGILISYIPKINIKKFNYNIIPVILLIPIMLYLAYIKKNFFMLLLMILLFGALVYFSSSISVGGKVFDLLGQLSVRIYLYMAFITVFEGLGLTDSRVLFVINITIATLDLIASYYMKKYKALKKQIA